MRVTLNIPKPIEDALERQLGDALERTAREGLAIEAYRADKLSLGQFAEMLAISVHDADGLLKQRGIYLDLTMQELEEDVASLRELGQR